MFKYPYPETKTIRKMSRIRTCSDIAIFTLLSMRNYKLCNVCGNTDETAERSLRFERRFLSKVESSIIIPASRKQGSGYRDPMLPLFALSFPPSSLFSLSLFLSFASIPSRSMTPARVSFLFRPPATSPGYCRRYHPLSLAFSLSLSLFLSLSRPYVSRYLAGHKLRSSFYLHNRRT